MLLQFLIGNALNPEAMIRQMAHNYSLLREGDKIRRKYQLQISRLKDPNIICGEGAESAEELNDETLNCGQSGF